MQWRGTVLLELVNSSVSMEPAGRPTVRSCGLKARLLPLAVVPSKTNQLQNNSRARSDLNTSENEVKLNSDVTFLHHISLQPSLMTCGVLVNVASAASDTEHGFKNSDVPLLSHMYEEEKGEELHKLL